MDTTAYNALHVEVTFRYGTPTYNLGLSGTSRTYVHGGELDPDAAVTDMVERLLDAGGRVADLMRLTVEPRLVEP